MFPEKQKKNKKGKTRDYEAEREQERPKQRQRSSGHSSTGAPPPLEPENPFAKTSGVKPTRVASWPLDNKDLASPGGSGDESPSSTLVSLVRAGFRLTVVDLRPPQNEKDEKKQDQDDNEPTEYVDQEAHHDEDNEDGGKEVGGQLADGSEQWEEEFDEPDPPVRNAWGRIRFALREPLAEWLGMMVLIIIGIGSDCQVKLSGNQVSHLPPSRPLALTDLLLPQAGGYSDQNWSWGFGVMASTCELSSRTEGSIYNGPLNSI